MTRSVPASIVRIDGALESVAREKRRGGRITLTNGCFDLLHAGHVEFLRACAGFGEYLVVGLNDDASVRRLKGAGRPLVAEEGRAALLAALRWVDLVVLFEGATADDLIESLQPDVYAKGADYDSAAGGAELPERETVRKVGCQLRFVPLAEGISTTALLERAAMAGTRERGHKA